MRRCWHRRGWPAALLGSAAVVLAVAGCGSITKKDVIARANAICATAQRDLRAVAAPSSTSPAALVSYLGQVVPIVDIEASQFRALPRPKQDLPVLGRWIESVQFAAADFRALRAGARLNDRQAINTAYAALRTSDETALAARYGAGVCAASTGTVSAS
jgi:hypothetical protein